MGRSGSVLPWLLAAMMLGIAVARRLELSSIQAWFLAGIGLMALLGALKARRRLHPYGFLAAACFAFCALGILSLSLRLPKNQTEHYLLVDSSEKHVLRIRLEERLRPGNYGRRWIGTVNSVNGGPTLGKILVRLPSSEADSTWNAGDHLTAFGGWAPFSTPLNPHGFDYGEYMSQLGVPAQIRLSKGTYQKTNSGPVSLRTHLLRLRAYLSQRLALADLDPEPRGIIHALILGDRTQLNPELYRAYQRSGTVHLLAISGLHVGVVMGLISWLLLPLRHHPGGRRWHLGISLTLLWVYALVVGFGPSVVRASVLFTILAWAFYRNKKGDGKHFLALAGLIMLGTLNPYWLFQPGFQLSFAAVWGIISFYAVIRKRWPFQSRVLNRVGDLIAISLAAQIGVLPISLYHFHQLPLLFLPGSIILVPLLGLLLLLGFLILLLCVAGLPSTWLTTLLNTLLHGQNSLVRMLSEQDGFVLTGIRWEAAHLFFSLALLFCLSQWLKYRKAYWITFGGITLVGLHIWILCLSLRTHISGEWMVPHQIASSSILVRQSNRVVLHTDQPEKWSRMLRDYSTGEGVGPAEVKPLRNAYNLEELRILLVDSSGVYPKGINAPDYLILRGSPPVHLERLLKSLRPAMVIADGSNYNGDLGRWAVTCETFGVPFHATALNGVFRQAILRNH